MRKHVKVLFLGGMLLLLLGLGGCQKFSFLWPSPHPQGTPSPSPSPGGVFTPSPPTPTPDGPLPTVIAEIDLGVQPQNAYRPAALATEGDFIYVVCQHCAGPDRGPACLSVVDRQSKTIKKVWVLPGSSTGPLAVGGGKIYVNYERDYDDRLLVLDASTGQILHDIDISFLGYHDRIWLDRTHRYLYLPLKEGLQVLDANSLQPLKQLAYPFETTERHVAYDAQRERFYLALSNALYAYQTPELKLLWQVDVPAQRITSLLVDASGTFIIVQGSTQKGKTSSSQVLFYSPEGELLGKFSPSWKQSWQLVWADANSSRIVYQGSEYSPFQPTQVRLWSTDLEGYPIQSTLFFDSRVQALENSSSLFVLGWRSHELTEIDGITFQAKLHLPLGVELYDLVVDHDQGYLYVNDTASRLYELRKSGRGELVPKRTLSAGSGKLALFSADHLLLAAQAGGDGSRVCVANLETFQVTQVITGGNQIAIDTRRAHAIVGRPAAIRPSFQGETQVWDLARQERVGTIPQAGPPAYNPLRDEIYIGGYTCHIYDAETLQKKGSLTPDIDAQECQGCTGQPAVIGVSVHPRLNLLALHMTITSAGKGPGLLPAPRLFALDSLSPLTHTVTFLQSCKGVPLIWPPFDGKIFENLIYSRYITRVNLLVRKTQTNHILSWRDGLALEMLSPDGKIGFIQRGSRWLAVDTQTWEPLGYTPRFCIHSYDRENQVFYALEGSRLYVLSPRWGKPLPIRAPQRETIHRAVRAIQVSPGYGKDRTVFAVSENALYRSRDGGKTWERLRGGLPQIQYPDDAHLTVVVSPNYLRDRTVFLGGWDGAQGLGIWRSTDGGDTWHPLWNGLTHLKVERIVISPNYAQDGTLVAYCRYDDLRAPESGRSVFISSNSGESWRLVDRVSQAEATVKSLPKVEELLGTAPRRSLKSESSETSKGRGLSPALPPHEYPVGQASLPSGGIYILSSLRLYRSLDGGSSWEVARGSLFQERKAANRFTALSFTFDAEGKPLLFLGDITGQVLPLRPEELSWEALPKK